MKRQDAEYKLIGGGHLPGDLATSVNPDGQQTGQQKRFGTGCAEQKTFPIPTEVETRRQVTLSFRIMRQSYYQSLYHWWQKKANPITIWWQVSHHLIASFLGMEISSRSRLTDMFPIVPYTSPGEMMSRLCWGLSKETLSSIICLSRDDGWTEVTRRNMIYDFCCRKPVKRSSQWELLFLPFVISLFRIIKTNVH